MDYSGFSTLNNQKFGQRFVGKVANPNEMLVFHKRSSASASASSSTARGTGARRGAANDAVASGVAEAAETSIDDLVRENLERAGAGK